MDIYIFQIYISLCVRVNYEFTWTFSPQNLQTAVSEKLGGNEKGKKERNKFCEKSKKLFNNLHIPGKHLYINYYIVILMMMMTMKKLIIKYIYMIATVQLTFSLVEFLWFSSP